VHARELLELARRHTRTLSRVIRETSEVEAIVRARRDQALGDCRERAAERAYHGREVTQQIFRPLSRLTRNGCQVPEPIRGICLLQRRQRHARMIDEKKAKVNRGASARAATLRRYSPSCATAG